MAIPNPKSALLRNWVILVLAAFMGTACPGGRWLGDALAQPQQDLAQAEEHIQFGEFDEALTILDSLIHTGDLSGDPLREAYALKGRGHALKGQDYLAIDAFCKALNTDPDWRPDEIEYTEPELELFEQAIGMGCHEKPEVVDVVDDKPDEGGSKKWYYVAGTAVVGVLAVILLGGSDEVTPSEDQLDDFPDPPGK